MMTNLNRTETARWLEARNDFVILTHRKPDGDTVGTAAALCRGLRAAGKRAWILENPELTPRFAYLHDGLTCPEVKQEHTLVSVDVAAPNMLPKSFEPLLGRIGLRIDHHGSATGFTDFALVDPLAGACAEIVWDVLTEMGVTMDAAMAEAVYTAVSTDTGCFRFANTTEHTFLVASHCAAAGAPVFQLNRKLFETVSRSRLRLQGWLVENCRMLLDGRAAVCPIPKAVEEALGVTEDDTDNIASFLRTLEGVEMAATLRENADGTVKISVRSDPTRDSGKVCAVFGGGGHKGAAGATMQESLNEAADILAEEIRKLFAGEV